MADELGKIRVPSQPLEEILAKYTVPELQQELKRRGLKRSGVKRKLIHRLKEAIEAEEADNDDEINDTSQNTNDSEVLDESQTYDPKETSVKEQVELDDPYAEFERSIPGVADVVADQLHESHLKESSTHVNKEDREEDVEEGEKEEEGKKEEEGEKEEEAEVNIPGEPEIVCNEENGNEEDGVAEANEELNKEDLIPTYEEKPANQIEADDNRSDTEDDSKEDPQMEIMENEHHGEEVSTNEQLEFGAPFQQQMQDTAGEHVEEMHDDQIQKADKEELNEDVIDQKQREEEKEDCDITEATLEEDNKDEMHEDSEEIGIKVGIKKNEETDDFDENKEDSVNLIAAAVQETKQVKKHTTPVQLKKRKITVDAADSPAKQETGVPRKRRWGSSASKEVLAITSESLAISSESLKGLIPEVSVIPSPNDDLLGLGLDYGDMEEGEIDEAVEVDTQPHEDEMTVKEAEELEEREEGNFKKEVKRGRIVRISTKDTIKLQRADEAKEEITVKDDNIAEKVVEMKVPDEKVSLLPDISSEDPDFVREKSPSPPRNDPSKTLSVRNLVRPFTLRQLREFLSKSGTVVEEGFWINRIKSHCYVTYATEEEAITSRSAIHGTRWPAANPKLLSVDFAVNDEMYRETEGKLGEAPSPVKIEEVKPKFEREITNERHRGRERIEQARDMPRDKSHDKPRDKSRDKEIRVEESAKPKEKKEAPGKLLDDLFRKTKATPSIYWLPLTKDQISAKEKEREERREERRKLNEEAVKRETQEREERRKRRETEEKMPRQSPQRYQNRHPGLSNLQEGRNRSPKNEQRSNRQLPAQYRKGRASSSSSADGDSRPKFGTRR